MALIKYWRLVVFLAGIFGAGTLYYFIRDSGKQEVYNEILRQEKKALKNQDVIDARPHLDPADLLKRMRNNGF